MNSKKIKCKKCGSKVNIPFAWVLGLEIILHCNECKTKYLTGYKMGAFLSAIALVNTLTTANIFIFLTSSILIPLIAILIIPTWIYIGYKFRLFWLLKRKTKVSKRADEPSLKP